MDDDGPEDGDDRLPEGPKPDPKPRTNLIVLPGGKTIDPREEIGVDYVDRQAHMQVLDPSIVDPVAVDAEVRERDRYVSSQRLVEAVKDKASTSDIMEATLREIAEEISHLKFERRKAIREGKNTANYSVSRIAGLRSLADLLLKRQEASRSERLDLRSPRLQAIFQVWMEFFYESMEKVGVDQPVIDLVFKQMKADMIGWERRMDVAEKD